MLTDAQLGVDRKKRKKKMTLAEHRTHANPTAKPAAQSPSQWGMREYNRSTKSKKETRNKINISEKIKNKKRIKLNQLRQ
jgi:hypothetical protein